MCCGRATASRGLVPRRRRGMSGSGGRATAAPRAWVGVRVVVPRRRLRRRRGLARVDSVGTARGGVEVLRRAPLLQRRLRRLECHRRTAARPSPCGPACRAGPAGLRRGRAWTACGGASHPRAVQAPRACGAGGRGRRASALRVTGPCEVLPATATACDSCVCPVHGRSFGAVRLGRGDARPQRRRRMGIPLSSRARETM